MLKYLLTFLSFSLSARVQFVIVTPTYNNETVCIKNLQSTLEQTYTDWQMIIINDCSTDRTGELLHTYIVQHQLEHKVELIHNTQRKGALCNLYDTIHTCPDDTVIINYDGDDWWYSKHALARIAREYQDPQVWLTYGQYCDSHGRIGMCKPFPEHVLRNRTFRTYQWISSHPRTYKAWLFKKIKQEDLMFQGTFFFITCDLAIMFPMLEMASNGHIGCISEILYVYNVQNPLNDFKQNFDLQNKLDAFIRSKAPYEPL